MTRSACTPWLSTAGGSRPRRYSRSRSISLKAKPLLYCRPGGCTGCTAWLLRRSRALLRHVVVLTPCRAIGMGWAGRLREALPRKLCCPRGRRTHPRVTHQVHAADHRPHPWSGGAAVRLQGRAGGAKAWWRRQWRRRRHATTPALSTLRSGRLVLACTTPHFTARRSRAPPARPPLLAAARSSSARRQPERASGQLYRAAELGVATPQAP
mgnify:CR=1 FL=1